EMRTISAPASESNFFIMLPKMFFQFCKDTQNFQKTEKYKLSMSEIAKNRSAEKSAKITQTVAFWLIFILANYLFYCFSIYYNF
ncbi:MAG: hypothetical protein ACI3ZO_05125, partial [Candidatus Cryptobacteroides sp.]